jgi:hypothetical protein
MSAGEAAGAASTAALSPARRRQTFKRPGVHRQGANALLVTPGALNRASSGLPSFVTGASPKE